MAFSMELSLKKDTFKVAMISQKAMVSGIQYSSLNSAYGYGFSLWWKEIAEWRASWVEICVASWASYVNNFSPKFSIF